MQVTGGGAIRLTTALYFTPSGRSIQKEGIKPDIEVEQAKVETIQARPGFREENLRRSITNPNDKPGDKPAADKPAPSAPDANAKPADKPADKPAAGTAPAPTPPAPADQRRSGRAPEGHGAGLPAPARRRPDPRHLALQQPQLEADKDGSWRGRPNRTRPARALAALA